MDKRVRPEGIELRYLPMGMPESFFRMSRHREFDASEMSLSWYTRSAFDEPRPFLAIPVFPSRMFRHGAIYVNTARAALHDTDAMVKALTDGTILAAGLDHFDGEVLAVDHPLASLPNVVLTPHIGGATYDTEANHSKVIADGLATLLAGGSPPNLVNPEVLET